MRDASTGLIEVQKTIPATPCFKVEVQGFGYPAKTDDLRVNLFDWQKVYSDSTTAKECKMAFAGDGSLIRIKLVTGMGAPYYQALYYQRIENPGAESDYDNWTILHTANNGGIDLYFGTVIAHENEVLIFSGKETAALYTHYTWTGITMFQSTNYGATFDGGTVILNDIPNGANYLPYDYCAACYKPNGDVAVVAKIYTFQTGALRKRVSGVWSGVSSQSTVNYPKIMFYEDDWNIISYNAGALVGKVYGDGGNVALNTWADATPSLSDTEINDIELVEDRRFTWSSGMLSGSGHIDYFKAITSDRFAELYIKNSWGSTATGFYIHGIKIEGIPFMLSLYQAENSAWFFMLCPDAEFYDNCIFEKAEVLHPDNYPVYAMSLAYDGTYLWAGDLTQLYKCFVPTSWVSPSAGSGAGDTNNLTDLASIFITRCKQIKESPSDLEIVFDNSSGQFASPGSGDIDQLKKGSIIKLDFGYEVVGTPTYPTSKNYARMAIKNFESWNDVINYPDFSFFSLYGEDGMSLLSRKKMPKPMEWNKYSDTKSIYDIIGDLIATIGGTLTYISRSDAITAIYPKLKVSSGETMLSIINSLISKVDDVIRWYGIDAEIIYPQSTDSEDYIYRKSGG